MIRRVLLVLGLLLGLVTVLAPAAQAATGPQGRITSAVQDTFTHRVTVRGWVYDTRKPGSSIGARFYVAGKYAGRVSAKGVSPTLNKNRGIRGKHAFIARFTVPNMATSVTLASVGIGTRLSAIDLQKTKHLKVSLGARIVAVAKRYVGKVPYVAGGSSPRQGFDCSGYSRYAYAVAGAGNLPHNADAQRRMRGMHRISASQARPGDLVFYQTGNYSHHVAIYAGNHMQYSASTPRDGIRYQPIWATNIVYGHLG